MPDFYGKLTAALQAIASYISLEQKDELEEPISDHHKKKIDFIERIKMEAMKYVTVEEVNDLIEKTWEKLEAATPDTEIELLFDVEN